MTTHDNILTSTLMHSVNKDDVWNSPTAILSSFDADKDGVLNYEEFHTLCVRLFGMNEVKKNEEKIREILKLFDTDADSTLNEHELERCYKWIQEIVNPINVLLIVDVQNDFIDGTLALRNCGYKQEGAEVVEPINRLLKNGRWDKVIYTQDWHPEDHISFFESVKLRKFHSESTVTQEKAKLFDTVVFSQPYITQTLWPKHCVKGTWGAEIHKNLFISPSSGLVHKGYNPERDMYSAFGDNGIECTDKDCSKIKEILSMVGATHLYVCGLAYDVCIKHTCLDGLQLGYPLAVIDDACRGINPKNITSAKNLIAENGGLVADSNYILSLINKRERSLVMAYHAAKKM